MANRKGIEYKYPELKHGVDFEVINEGEVGQWPEVFDWSTDKYPKPTDTEMGQWFLQADCIEKRRAAYIAAGLTWEYWNEINVEGDQEKIDKYHADRQAIREQFPKPTS